MKMATIAVPGLPTESYQSSDTVLSGISAAGSRRYNTPSFERLWHAPWRAAFDELMRYAAPYIQVYSEHPIYLNRQELQEFKVKAQFKSAGVDWTDTDEQIQEKIIPPKPAHPTIHATVGRRTSERLAMEAFKKEMKEVTRATQKADKLIASRDAVLQHIFNGEYSIVYPILSSQLVSYMQLSRSRISRSMMTNLTTPKIPLSRILMLLFCTPRVHQWYDRRILRSNAIGANVEEGRPGIIVCSSFLNSSGSLPDRFLTRSTK